MDFIFEIFFGTKARSCQISTAIWGNISHHGTFSVTRKTPVNVKFTCKKQTSTLTPKQTDKNKQKNKQANAKRQFHSLNLVLNYGKMISIIKKSCKVSLILKFRPVSVVSVEEKRTDKTENASLYIVYKSATLQWCHTFMRARTD